jgi:hypothetical protein
VYKRFGALESLEELVGLAFHFADPALSLLPDYRDPCAIDFHIDDGDGRTEGNRQIELQAALDLGLFEPHDCGADLLGLTLYEGCGKRFCGEHKLTSDGFPFS